MEVADTITTFPPTDCETVQSPRPRAPQAHVQRLLQRFKSFPLASKGLLSLADQVIVSGASFATAVIINRTAAAEQIGLYYLTVSILAVTVGIQDSVVSVPFTIYSKRRKGRELAEYATSTWLHLLALIGVAVGMLLAAVAIFSLAGSTTVVPGLWALAGAAPLLLLREGIRRFAFASLDLTSALALDAVVAIAQLAGIAGLAYAGTLSIFSIYGVMAGACALGCAGWFLLDRPVARFKPGRFRTDWNVNWPFGKWALRSYLVGSTTPYLMPWIIDAAIGTAATGMFGACATLIGVTNMFLTSVDRVLTPRASQAFFTGGRDDLRRVLGLSALVLLVTLGGLCLVVFATGSKLAVIVYGPKFADCGGILAALSLSALMAGWGMVAGIGLWAMEKPQTNLVADVCCLVVTLVMAVLLVVPFGAFGAALAILGGTSTGTLVRVLSLQLALHAAAPTNPPAHLANLTPITSGAEIHA